MEKVQKTNSFIIILIFLITFMSINVGNTSIQQRPNIKIGVLVPDKMFSGNQAIKGINLAVEEINVDGVNVGGTVYNLEIFTETSSGIDGFPNVATASTSLAKLQDDNDVLAIIGGFNFEVVTQLQKELFDTPFLGIGSVSPITSDLFFRIGPTNGSRQAYALAELYGVVMNDLGVKNITIVREDSTWAVSMAGAVKAIIAGAYASKGVINNFTFTEELVISESATPIAVESVLSSIEEDVNALLTIISGSVGRFVTEKWTKLNMTQYLAGINDESQRNDFFTVSKGGSFGEIELETVPTDINITVKSAPFKVSFNDRFQESPSHSAFISYDATYILVEAIKASGSPTDGVVLQSVLVNTDFVGAAGRYKFTSEPGQTTASNTITVHDLFTPLNYGVHAGEFMGGRFAQWQKNGEKVTIWGMNSFTEDLANLKDEGLPKLIRAPINHSDFGTLTNPTVSPLSSSIFSSSSFIISSSISQTSTSKSITITTTPGYSSFIIIILIFFSISSLIIKNRKQ